jgi:hypothetical protein
MFGSFLPSPMVVKQPKSTRVKEPTPLCNHFHLPTTALMQLLCSFGALMPARRIRQRGRRNLPRPEPWLPYVIYRPRRSHAMAQTKVGIEKHFARPIESPRGLGGTGWLLPKHGSNDAEGSEILVLRNIGIAPVPR